MRSDLGADVECPHCQTVYQALDAAAPAPQAGSGNRRSLRAVEDEEEARPSRRSRQAAAEVEEDVEEARPSRRGRKSSSLFGG